MTSHNFASNNANANILQNIRNPPGDRLQTARKFTVPILLVVNQLVVIITFGGGWTRYSGWGTIGYGSAPYYALLVPFPSGVEWWCQISAVAMYIALAISILYVFWNIAQVTVPERTPAQSNLKQKVLIDMVVSLILTILLISAFAFFASGYSSSDRVVIGRIVIFVENTSYGYCFWLCVVAAVGSFVALLISAITWLKS